jgi:hypothetical protein
MMAKKTRKNPEIKPLVNKILGEDYKNVKTAVIMAVGGGLALGIAQSILTSRVDTGTNLGKGLVAVFAGLGGGILASWVGETLGDNAVGNFLRAAAIPGAIGAMTLGFWTVAQPHVEPQADWVSQKLGFAGYGDWMKEFDMGDYVLGQTELKAEEYVEPEDNPFLTGYEPLGQAEAGEILTEELVDPEDNPYL